MAAAAAALLLVAAPAAQAAGAAPGPIDLVGLDFQVINDNSDKCLADSGDGRTLVQKACRKTEAQRWRFVPLGIDGAFRIVNVGTEKCLSGDGRRAVLAGCDSAAPRRWQLRDSDDPYAQMRNVASGRCLTVAGGSTADGTSAQQYTCDNKKSRRWTVRVVSVPFISTPFL